MTGIDQITVHAEAGSSGRFESIHSSISHTPTTDQWLLLLDPWLRIGRPLGCCYLNIDDSFAAFIRWYADPSLTRDWEYALVFVGQASLLTARYALELPGLDRRTMRAGDGQHWATTPDHGPEYDTIEAMARSADAVSTLVPVLAHTLEGDRSLTMPWTDPGLVEAVMWGVVSILDMISDANSVSFLANTSATITGHGLAGPLITFRPDAPVVPPAPRYDSLAGRLALRFAADPAGLRQLLAENGPFESATDVARIERLIAAGPGTEAGSADTKGSQNMVTCPICLHQIPDWNNLEYHKWDARRHEYVLHSIPAGLNEKQLARHLQGAYRRCPSGDASSGTAHYLPVNYGQFGDPVMLGFIGLSKSGKSHLMASMVGAIEKGGLEEFGITYRPLDHAGHQRLLREQVEPLLNENKELPGTPENLRTFADAFLIRDHGGPERPVILFDVAGGDLAKEDESKEFLWIVDGLFFVIDPDFVETQRVGDTTFANVLSVVQNSGRRDLVSAAIVLSKADKVRFDEPIARWLRFDSSSLDPDEVLRESADIYAYLCSKGASALTRPYHDCPRATLHATSPTGGPRVGEPDHGTFPRGVSPHRVLRPLVAMLAMTGVLTGPQAERVGI